MTTTPEFEECVNCGKEIQYVMGSCRNCGAERPPSVRKPDNGQKASLDSQLTVSQAR
jgi:predicted amidophosphoribosyltransferase